MGETLRSYAVPIEDFKEMYSIVQICEQIETLKLQITLKAEKDRIKLPVYLGSTIRGALASALKKTVCALKLKTCEECILKERCAYSYLFETPLPSDAKTLRSYDSIPRPIVIEPKEYTVKEEEQDRDVVFNLILIGKAIEYQPYLIAAADLTAKMGLGKDRYPFSLKEVLCISKGETKSLWPTKKAITPAKGDFMVSIPKDRDKTKLTVRFETPTRILTEGKVSSPIEFKTLIKALLSRVTAAANFHCGLELNIDAKAILQYAETIEIIDHKLKPTDLKRWSNRQNQKIEMWGLTGEISYQGEAIAPLMPLLRMGEIIHVGKGTVFGMGRFGVEE